MYSQLDCLVPVLDGTNYLVWAEQMTAYLRSQGLWGYPNNDIKSPGRPGPTATATEKEVFDQWVLKDNQAIGTIVLRTSVSCWIHFKNKISSWGHWTALKEAYSKVGASVISADFRQAVGFCISSAGHPATDCDKLQSLMDRL